VTWAETIKLIFVGSPLSIKGKLLIKATFSGSLERPSYTGLAIF
jgi:hypothetical protein